MIVVCDKCGLALNDAKRNTICPHPWIMSEESMLRKEKAITLLGRSVRRIDQPDSKLTTVESVGFLGMVTLRGEEGTYSPFLFAIVDPK